MSKLRKTLAFETPEGQRIELDWDYANGERIQEVHDRAGEDWSFQGVEEYQDDTPDPRIDVMILGVPIGTAYDRKPIDELFYEYEDFVPVGAIEQELDLPMYYSVAIDFGAGELDVMGEEGELMASHSLLKLIKMVQDEQ